MKLIVESGATKTAWRAVTDDGAVRQVVTDGLSPTCLDEEYTRHIVGQAVPELNPSGSRVDRIFFYGAGLVSRKSASSIGDALNLWCPFAQVEYHSDLLASCRALFGDGSGVVAIMGTGSNSCLYEDGRIVRNIRPGGYILGDEGSAVCLGRTFLADYVKGLLPKPVEEDFVKEFGLDYSRIVSKVYKEQAVSAFMASIAPFVVDHAENDGYMSEMVDSCVESFIVRALSRYAEDVSSLSDARKVGVTGSFGFACRNRIESVGRRYDLEFVRFLKSPIDELVKYHMDKDGI